MVKSIMRHNIHDSPLLTRVNNVYFSQWCTSTLRMILSYMINNMPTRTLQNGYLFARGSLIICVPNVAATG